MNKKQLLEAIKDYPDEAQILVSVGSKLVNLDNQKPGEASLVYRRDTPLAFALSVSGHPTDVVIEL